MSLHSQKQPSIFIVSPTENPEEYEQLITKLSTKFTIHTRGKLVSELDVDRLTSIRDSIFIIVLLLDGVSRSREVRHEIEIAKNYNKTIILISHKQLKESLPKYLTGYAIFEIVDENKQDIEIILSLAKIFKASIVEISSSNRNLFGFGSFLKNKLFIVLAGLPFLFVAVAIIFYSSYETNNSPNLTPTLIILQQTQTLGENTVMPTSSPLVGTSRAITPTLTDFEIHPTDYLSTEVIDISKLFEIKAPQTNSEWEPIEYEIEGNSVVFVPSGCFTQGITQQQIKQFCTENDIQNCEDQFEDEIPSHRVCLSGFWLDQFEVSRNRYDESASKLPQTQISWQQAEQHCIEQKGYLVTEAQWEYAARGVDNLLYVVDSLAKLETPEVVNLVTNDTSWVGAYRMNSNVREWVFDNYIKDFYAFTSTDNPVAQNEGLFRVIKGASWVTENMDARLSKRYEEFYDNSLVDVGFRCAYPIDVVEQ